MFLVLALPVVVGPLVYLYAQHHPPKSPDAFALNMCLMADFTVCHILGMHPPIGLRERFGITAYLIPQTLHKAGIVKDANALRTQVTTHPLGIAERIEAAGQYQPVIAAEHTIQLVSILFGQHFVCHCSSSSFRVPEQFT
jgi:hypothetical protein